MASQYLIIKNLLDILEVMINKVRMTKITKILMNSKQRSARFILGKIISYI